MMNAKSASNHAVSTCSYESIKPKATENRQFVKIDTVCEELKSFGSDTFDFKSDCVFETNYDGKIDYTGAISG